MHHSPLQIFPCRHRDRVVTPGTRTSTWPRGGFLRVRDRGIPSRTRPTRTTSRTSRSCPPTPPRRPPPIRSDVPCLPLFFSFEHALNGIVLLEEFLLYKASSLIASGFWLCHKSFWMERLNEWSIPYFIMLSCLFWCSYMFSICDACLDLRGTSDGMIEALAPSLRLVNCICSLASSAALLCPAFLVEGVLWNGIIYSISV